MTKIVSPFFLFPLRVPLWRYPIYDSLTWCTQYQIPFLCVPRNNSISTHFFCIWGSNWYSWPQLLCLGCTNTPLTLKKTWASRNLNQMVQIPSSINLWLVISLLMGSSPIFPLRYHSLVYGKHNSSLVVIIPLLRKYLIKLFCWWYTFSTWTQNKGQVG